MFNESKLAGKMAEHHISGDKMASILGINPSTFYRKKIGESEFTRNEIQIIANTLSLTMDDVRNIFFSQ